ncbi:hypothetical protein FGO68_gene17464 [Halteria grandinella]|uniref:Uncharacterized protein n=1 Tax=Halteria grandinella TaxID=5974 RepID=A0A8J8NGZ1_HALGN|nr:hypothetical protein FGO68_gene17464 [Halteria grandinella]
MKDHPNQNHHQSWCKSPQNQQTNHLIKVFTINTIRCLLDCTIFDQAISNSFLLLFILSRLEIYYRHFFPFEVPHCSKGCPILLLELYPLL